MYDNFFTRITLLSYNKNFLFCVNDNSTLQVPLHIYRAKLAKVKFLSDVYANYSLIMS